MEANVDYKNYGILVIGDPDAEGLRAKIADTVKSVKPQLTQKFRNITGEKGEAAIDVAYAPDIAAPGFAGNLWQGKPVDLAIVASQEKIEDTVRAIKAADGRIMPIVLFEGRPEQLLADRLLDASAVIVWGEQRFTKKNKILVPFGDMPIPHTFPQLVSLLLLQRKEESSKNRERSGTAGSSGQTSDRRAHHEDFMKIRAAFGNLRPSERREHNLGRKTAPRLLI